jgi:transposase
MRVKNSSTRGCSVFTIADSVMQIVFSSSCRYFMHSGSIDMRKGFDGLCGLIQQDFHQSALSGDVFIFRNAQGNRMKLLHWQGDGFVIYYKRLEKGTFEIPGPLPGANPLSITHQQLSFILEGIVLSSVKKRLRFQRENVGKTG